MSRMRLEVACYGRTTAVLSTDLNSATHARFWLAEIYYEPQRAQPIQLVAIVGGDGDQPRFEMPQDLDGVRHCIWLMHGCIELPAASWTALKAFAEGVMQGSASSHVSEESRA
ncbi:hypothetical protein A7D35_02820 [Xanthomonas arboricola]|uniref:hypothetical protein n=1 Tax=Xanthomonas arboricola TaxID=56448 RepID=UPI0007ECBFF2|nr:hypothetical protein [Xanthomonas arboricola]OBR78763.1 hypothetical protein A7D35_02820 [Xanthomonas arboricola]